MSSASSAARPNTAARAHRVLVFTTPMCPRCRRAKWRTFGSNLSK